MDFLTPTRVEPTATSPPAVPESARTLHGMEGAAKACGFQILRPLGSGGMASVFLALDEKLGRPVALKFPTITSRHTEQMLALLKREAENAASLIHENIVQVYSWHEHGSYLFFAMELVEGETLLDRVKSGGPLEGAEALRIAMECANGLAAAHKRGIIHHDIKPANIMIRHDGRVKVADLGISTNADERSRMMQAMVVRGTTGYMAPEQARGEVTTAASDVYSLGLVLYYMVSGRSAYVFPQGTSKLDRLKANQAGQIRPLREAAPDVPKALARLIGQMLEAAPSRRVQSMQAFQALARKVFLGLEKRPQTWLGRQLVFAGRLVRRLKQPALVAGGVAGGFAAAAVWYEGRTVERARLEAAGAAVLEQISTEAQAVYAANPTNGQIGTSVAFLVKSRETKNWPLTLQALQGLRDQGILRVVNPAAAGPGAVEGPARTDAGTPPTR